MKVKTKEECQEEKRRRVICESLVETAGFYGWRTAKAILRFARGEKKEGFFGPVQVKPSSKRAQGFKGHAIRELNGYRNGRVESLRQQLDQVPFARVEWLTKNIGRIRCMLRYGSKQELDPMPDAGPVVLKNERPIHIDGRQHRKIEKWLRTSKPIVAQRRKQGPPKKRKLTKNRISTRSYIESILGSNKGFEQWDAKSRKRVSRVQEEIDRYQEAARPKLKTIRKVVNGKRVAIKKLLSA